MRNGFFFFLSKASSDRTPFGYFKLHRKALEITGKIANQVTNCEHIIMSLEKIMCRKVTYREYGSTCFVEMLRVVIVLGCATLGGP